MTEYKIKLVFTIQNKVKKLQESKIKKNEINNSVVGANKLG